MKTSKILAAAALVAAVIAGAVLWRAPDPQTVQLQPTGAADPTPAPTAVPGQAPSPGLVEAIPDVPAPEEDEQQQLVARSMALFAEAVNRQDLGALEASGSSVFRQPENLVELRRNVQAYVDQGIDLSRLENVVPEIHSRFIDGRWVLAGAYRVESAQIGYSFAFELDRGEWRVAAMKVELP